MGSAPEPEGRGLWVPFQGEVLSDAPNLLCRGGNLDSRASWTSCEAGGALESRGIQARQVRAAAGPGGLGGRVLLRAMGAR